MRVRALLSLCATIAFFAGPALAWGASDQGLSKVNHIILLMQENHSFDNYLGVLALAPGSPYHGGECAPTDHACVDGLSCTGDAKSGYRCTNSNDDDGSTVFPFHATDFCVKTDVNHAWIGTHQEANFNNPNDALVSSPNDGFVLVNDATNQQDNKQPTPESNTEDETMSFYNENDIGFYYSLAETFAIDDRYFWGSGSSPAKSYYKDPGESLIGATFHPKIANPGFFGDFLREIITCNLDARCQAVKTGRISRNKPGV